MNKKHTLISQINSGPLNYNTGLTVNKIDYFNLEAFQILMLFS